MSNISGLGTSEMDGGLQIGQTGGAIRNTKYSGISRQTGGEIRGTDTTVDSTRKTKAISRGGSDRDNTGTTQVERSPEMAEGTQEQTLGDREQPQDIEICIIIEK